MSRLPYNPYASGNQNPPQGQYGLPNTQTERDSRRPASFLGYSSPLSSFGAHFGVPENSGGRMPAPLNYRSEPSRVIRDEDAKSSMDMHISKAREEARLAMNPMRQPMDQRPPFTSSQRDEFRPSGTGMTSYPMTSNSSPRDTHQFAMGSSNNNPNWLTRPSSDGSLMKSSSALSNLASGDRGRFDAPKEEQRVMQGIPGLGDFDYRPSNKPQPSTDANQPKYTSESASSILQRFGLEKEDLEHLISYPEDQITPANLPFILRQIRLEKDKKATTGVQPSPYAELQPTRTVGGLDSYSLNRGAEVHIEETASSVLQPSQVIDYGHIGKYTAGVGDDIGRKSERDNSGGSKLFMMDTAANRQNPEPLQKNTTDLKSSAFGSSREQGSSFPGPSSSYSPAMSSVAPPGSDQTKRLLPQPNQTFQNILSSFLYPKKDTDTRGLMSDASKPLSLKQPDGDRQASKAQVPSASSHGTHPSRPGLVLIGSNDPTDAKDSGKTKGKMSVLIEHFIKQRKLREQMQQQPTQPTKPAQQQRQPAQKQQSKQQTKQPQKKPAPQQTRKVLPPVFGKSVPTGGAIASQNKLLTSKKQPKDKVAASMDRPTPVMMSDYAAASPRIFPHSCTLCNKECTNMQDWISHQNSSLHLESCTLLRKRYPKWDGEIVHEPRATGKDAKPSTSAKKTRRGSRSRSKSFSPHRRPGSAGRKDKRRSRSRSWSPQSSKYNRSYRSRSQSPERPKRKDDRQSSPRRTRDRRSPFKRSNESWSPPRRADNRRSPLKRSNESWSPPRRSDDRWSPPRRGDERQSPQRRAGKRWSPPRRSDNSRSPQRRSQEGQEGSSPQQKGLNNAESLAKKLLETSAVQSLSNQSDLEAVVKTLAPALLAELAKMTSPSTSSSSKGGQRSVPPSSARRKKPSSSAASSTARMKGSTKALPILRSEVELRNIDEGVSYLDLVSALERFGRTTYVEIFRATNQGIVQFKKIGDGDILKRAGSLEVKGTRVIVMREKTAGTEKQTKHPLRKPARSSSSTPQTNTTRKTLLPTPFIPPLLGLTTGARKGTKGKLMYPKTAAKDPAKGSAKGVSTVAKAKVLVSKARNVSTKRITKTINTTKLPSKGTGKTAMTKQSASSASKAAYVANQQEPAGLKQQPIPVRTDTRSVTVTAKVVKPANMVNTKLIQVPLMEEKDFLTLQTPETPLEEPAAGKAEAVGEKLTLPAKPEPSDSRPGTGDSKEQLVPEKSEKGSVEVIKITNRTGTEPAKDPYTERKVLVTQAETTPTAQRPETQTAKPPGSGAVNIAETAVPLRPGNAGKQAQGESFKPTQSETRGQGSVEVQADTVESGKASPPTVVKLHGICSSLSHSEVVSAVERFGKTKSVVLFRARLEAVVIYEKVEDAKKLKSVKSLDVNGLEISIVGEKEAVSKELKTPHLRKPPSSSASLAESSKGKVPPPSLTAPKGVTAAATEKAFTPEASSVSTLQIMKTEPLAVKGDVKKGAAVKQNASSVSMLTSSEKTPKAAVEESVVCKSEVTEQVKDAGTVSTMQKPLTLADKLPAGETLLEESAKTDDAGEPMELEATGVKVSEHVPEDSANKNQTPTSSSETQLTETSVKASTQVQQSTLPELESRAQEPETRTEEAGTKTTQKETHIDPAVSTEVPSSSKPAAAMDQEKPAASQQSSPAVTPPTIGETLEKHLFPRSIYCRSFCNYQPENIPKGYKQVLISGLPLYHEGFYTEGDVANVLAPFGFRDKDNLFVIPQSCMAFAMMSSVENVIYLMRESVMNGIYFRGIRLLIEIVGSCFPLTPVEFYGYLKRVLKCSTPDEAERTVIIKNISQSEMRELREALKEFGTITNFMPLLSKLFIEFESVRDADTFEGWYLQMYPTPRHNVWPKRQILRLQSSSPGIEVMTTTGAALEKDASKTADNASAVTTEKVSSSTTTSEAATSPSVAEDATVPFKPEPEKSEPVEELTKTDQANESENKTVVEAKSLEPEPLSESLTATEDVSNKEVAKGNPPDSGDSEEKPENRLKGPGAGLKGADKDRTVGDPAKGQSIEEKVLPPHVELAPSLQKPQTEVESEVEHNEVMAVKVPGSLEVPTDAAEVVEEEDVAALEPNDEDEDEPMELWEQGVEEATSSEADPGNSAERPKEDQAETKTRRTAEEPSSSKPSSTSQQKKPAASKQWSTAVTRPTIGEMLEKHLFPHTIYCKQAANLSAVSPDRQLLITGLPTYQEGLYTEDDIADLLTPFGFQDKEDKLFVIPQSRMAFIMMPSGKHVFHLVRESEKNGLYLGEKELFVQVVCLRYPMRLLQFYRFLKKLLKCSALGEGDRTVLIRNISLTEMKELREALKDFAPIKNYTPLLNKLFVEFKFAQDVDRFEEWYGHLGHAPDHEVVRLKKQGPVTKLTTHKDAAKESHLTFGENFEKFLTKKKLGTIKSDSANTPKMLLSWLHNDTSHTEDDIIELLTPFGYQHKDHNIYVFPQACLAFVQMPTARDVFDILRASKRDPIMLNGSGLTVHALNDIVSLRPFWFYKSLMQLVNYPVTEDKDSVIFIRNISASEFQELREVLKKLDSVRNFWPLLNKVFIEFQTPRDADWLGVWYSLMKKPPDHRIQRLKIPHSSSSSCPAPKIPQDFLLESKDLIEGATLPSGTAGVPQGSTSPFWISLRNSPYVFPTMCPWFIIPEYQTAKGVYDIEKASRRGLMCPTVMLTGLPEGDYKHEDVARLVWPFFPKHTLRSLYYNVTVLPLQRRAFVFFADWTTCCDFVKAHIEKRNSLKGRMINVHFVLQNMYPESNEEAMYRSLMKLSNAGVPDLTSLEERLLCVEVSEVSLDVITLVIEMVASITTFVNFLPLANRICIEMADSSGVAQVVEKYNDLSPSSFTEDPAWSKVQNFETLESLRQRLQASDDVTINFEPATISEINDPSDIDKTELQSIRVTVGSQRLVRKGRSLSRERTGQDDFTEDNICSDAYLFDELQFNEEDFVTVDEVYDDAEPHHSSSSTRSSRQRTERQSSGGRRTSTRSSKDHRSSASSSSTARSTKGSRSSSSSTDLKNSSKPTKSSTKPSSSTSKASSSSSLLESTETPSSSGPGTHERESVKPTAGVQASVETQPEQLEEESEDGAVAGSDHRVSAEGSATETVESEAKMEARKEMHPPQQGQGLDLTQTQDPEVDLNGSTKKNQKKGKEDEKNTAGQILNSSDDQSNKRMEHEGQEGSSGPLPAGSEGGQIFDSVEDNPEEFVEMDVEGPSQEDSLALKQLSEEDAVPKTDEPTGKDGSGAGQETSNEDQCEEQAPRGKRTTRQKGREVKGSKASKEEGTHEGQTPDEGGNEEDLRDPDTDQAFEILDSIDDQTETEEDRRVKPEPSSAPTSEDKRPAEEEDDTYQVIDSVEDQTSESDAGRRQSRSRRGNAIARKDDRPSRRSNLMSETPKSAEKERSPKKQDQTRKTRAKMGATAAKQAGEEMLFEVVDSVEGEPVVDAAVKESFGRRRSTRGKKESEKPEEVTYEILDSVETANDEPTVTTRSRRGRTSEGAPVGKSKKEEDTPTRRRQTPARESRSREKTPKKEEKESSPTKKSAAAVGEATEEVATYQILDSVEDGVEDDPPATRGKGKRGRQKKQLKTAKKDNAASSKDDKDASEKVAEEDEATYQILDSVEDVDDQPLVEQPGSESKEDEQEQKSAPLVASSKSEEAEEEPLFQVVDSLEDDQEVQEEQTTAAAASDRERREETEDESLPQKVDASEVSVSDELSLTEESGTGKKVEDSSPIKSQSVAVTPERESKEKEQTESSLVNLDKVSDEEEDYPDDTAEEEELRKRQAAAKEKLLPRGQRARRTAAREEREQRSRRGGDGGGGGSQRGSKRGRVEVDSRELVTLDEVGADEVEDEKVPEEGTEGEAQALVTLDEFVEEEAEEGKVGVTKGEEAQALVTLDEFIEEERKAEQSQEDESVDDLNPETLVTLDEADFDEDDKPDVERTKKTQTSAKRKHDDDTEESMNFVIVDEVKDEDNREAATPRTRDRAKKRTRQTPVRKSTRGKPERTMDEREEEKKPTDGLPSTAHDASSSSSSSLDKDPSKLSNDVQEEVRDTAASQDSCDPNTAVTELQPPEEGEEEREGRSRMEVKVVSKQRRELDASEAKRSRSQSPSVPDDLPEFKPNNPLGKDFVVPGFFCNICSVFYRSESIAKEVHCSSQAHYDKLKKHYQKLREESISSTQRLTPTTSTESVKM
ncbi:uncharacterized protein LOC117807219 [Notolabrus celidotus]|uniref:uncharacterized protein LOC117807219 n=1 Tax=Notolabrus celidotus TaxID=1203425 RepID=UPI00148F4A11|nr:uncharacterized protein LOC117807219 [Notolabrus celidotus]